MSERNNCQSTILFSCFSLLIYFNLYRLLYSKENGQNKNSGSVYSEESQEQILFLETSCEIEQMNQKIDLNSFLVDDEKKLIYCWNHKVASSFFIDIFVKKHKTEQKNIVQGISHCYDGCD